MRETLPEEYRSEMAKGFLANKLILTEGATGVSQLRRQYQDPLLDPPRYHRPGIADRLRQSR